MAALVLLLLGAQPRRRHCHHSIRPSILGVVVPAGALWSGGALWIWLSRPQPLVARISLARSGIAESRNGFAADLFRRRRIRSAESGPIPQGTPVNLIMNINPEAPPEVLLDAGTALLRGALMVKAHDPQGELALHTFEQGGWVTPAQGEQMSGLCAWTEVTGLVKRCRMTINRS